MGQLTVVSISQHTQNDMSAWSPDVEEEREGLMASVSVIRKEKSLVNVFFFFLAVGKFLKVKKVMLKLVK